MKQQKILVVGSANTDMVIQTDHLPVLGETICHCSVGGKDYFHMQNW